MPGNVAESEFTIKELKNLPKATYRVLRNGEVSGRLRAWSENYRAVERLVYSSKNGKLVGCRTAKRFKQDGKLLLKI